MNGLKLKLAFSVGLASLLVALSINLIEAQKTSANSFQQQISGSNPNSVYGGYGQSSFNRRQQSSSSSSFVAPVNQKRVQSSYSSSKQQTNVVRQQQPVYQQQQQTSYESSESQQAEADAEPASYG